MTVFLYCRNIEHMYWPFFIHSLYANIACHSRFVAIKNSFPLPMIYLLNLFIFRYLNISAKVANSLPVICTLRPINWVETRNDDRHPKNYWWRSAKQTLQKRWKGRGNRCAVDGSVLFSWSSCWQFTFSVNLLQDQPQQSSPAKKMGILITLSSPACSISILIILIWFYLKSTFPR